MRAVIRSGAVGFIDWLDVGVISSWPTAADKRAKKNYRATNNENDCDPK
jgi:hypothetical protein